MTKPLIIFGSAEIAELAKFYFENDSDYRIAAFTVDDAFAVDEHVHGLPLVPFSEVAKRFPPAQFEMHVALSYARLNRLRQEKYEQAKAAGYRLASYVCSKSVTWSDLSIGDNCFILENQTIQPGVRIGNNVMIWSGNHLGHGTQIEDHAYIASHAVISGHCNIGERSFVGVNATLRDFCAVGKDCFVGMGADVARDMLDGSVALATSTEIYDETDRRAKVLKKSYFKL
ncbi:MAG: acetyltransferase [Thiobacillus sp.]|nr:acetyltransferase [Thiobacillus sp.]